MKLDATTVIPVIIIATLIIGWILAWGDIRELRKERDSLENDFWQERDFTTALCNQVVDLKDRIYWLEKPTTKEDLSTMTRQKKRTEKASAGDWRSPQSLS